MAEPAEWDARFRAGQHTGSSPDPFLISVADCLDLLPPGAAALDLACGAGRHSVWLAGRGFRVTAVDFSAEALARVQDQGIEVTCRQLDLEASDLDLGREVYDLICGFCFLHRPLFPRLRDALRPGGLIVYKTYTTDQLRHPGGPQNPAHLLQPNELLQLVAGFRVLRYEEIWEGRGTAALVARKPG